LSIENALTEMYERRVQNLSKDSCIKFLEMRGFNMEGFEIEPVRDLRGSVADTMLNHSCNRSGDEKCHECSDEKTCGGNWDNFSRRGYI